jgi:mRNA interferase RelE/StbE
LGWRIEVDPRALGEALRGPELGRLWKYRVGDWRLICDIRDGQVTVVVVRLGHRREVYGR